MEEVLQDRMEELGLCWWISYVPTLSRAEGDEFDYTAEDHYHCEIIVDEESTAHGWAPNEDEAKERALAVYEGGEF